MRRTRVLLLIDSLVRGGAQRQLVELALNLDARRFEPTVLIYFDLQQFRAELDAARIPVVLIEKKSKVDVAFLIRLTRFLRKHRPDVIHAYLNTPNFWARVGGKLAGIRFILTSERSGDIGHSFVRVALERVLQHFSHLIITNSESVKSVLVRRIGVPPDKIRVIYNGVDVRKFSAVANSELERLRRVFAISDQDFVVTLPGRLAAEKNHICLVKAVEYLGSARGRMKVLFVGNELDLLLKQRLIGEIKQRSLGDHFIFAGLQDDMAAIYALSNVVVLPSLWESFPNVLLEAMAASRPVIASNISDNRKLIEHGVNGFLFASNDERELANCLDALVNSGREKLARMGEAGLAIVQSRYSIEEMVHSYQTIYSSVSISESD